MPIPHLSRRRALAGAGSAGVLVPLSRSARAAPELKGTGEVIVFDGGGAWGKAQRVAYFEPFEKATGIKVVVAPRGPAGKFRASILAGAPAYDVADISAGQLGTFLQDKLLLAIDYSVFDQADRAAFEPVAAGDYMVPALFYSLVVSYSTAQFKKGGPSDWAQLWDTKAFPGQRSIAAGSQGPGGATYEIALLADGVAPDRLYPLDFDRALRSLDRIRPQVQKFWNAGAEPVQALIDGNVAAASAWNGRILDMQAQGGSLDLSWTQGILQWDAWVVPKGAANPGNAMKFLAFVSRPDRQAAFAQAIAYGPPNARAYDLIPPDRARVLPTAPPQRDRQIVQNYDFWASSVRPGFTNEQRATELWEAWVTKG